MRVVAWFVTVIGIIVAWGATAHPLLFVALIFSAIQLARVGLAPDIDITDGLAPYKFPGGDQ